MKKRLTNVSPVKLGITLAVVYGILSLLVVPFLLFASLFHGRGIAGVFVIFLPIIYAVFGFIGGVISAFIYNLVAKWTGGIEFITEEVS
jgi:hypothetical protein